MSTEQCCAQRKMNHNRTHSLPNYLLVADSEMLLADRLKPASQGSGVEFFISQPGLVQTQLNNRKLDSSKFFSNVIATLTKLSGQDAASASLNLQRPAMDPNVSGPTPF